MGKEEEKKKGRRWKWERLPLRHTAETNTQNVFTCFDVHTGRACRPEQGR